METTMPTVALSKLNHGVHYETSSGQAFGYNARQMKSKDDKVGETWQYQYPSAERVRVSAVAKLGTESLGLARLYNRSSSVQDAIAEETGLLGHSNVDNYDKAVAQGQFNTYATTATEDDGMSQQRNPQCYEPYHTQTGFPAGAQEAKTRRELAMPGVRWGSKLTAEQGPYTETNTQYNPKRTNYDSEYLDQFCNADRLDSSAAMRNTLSGDAVEFEARTLQPPSQSLQEQQSREPSHRLVTKDSLRNAVPPNHTYMNLDTSAYEGTAFDMRDSIPQYRNRRAPPNEGLTNVGIRNIGPVGRTKMDKFFTKPSMTGDTFTEFEARSLDQGFSAPAQQTYSRDMVVS